MGRPSAATAKRKQLENTLRVELQRQIAQGQCAYCRAPASPDRPLTREHVIPRARGGRRRDIRIIVPACLRCNSHRGCSELVPFLLSRPSRISSFLDYLCNLPTGTLRQLDARIFAELYAAIAILRDSAVHGAEWRRELSRLSSGRPLHRRRHAARRALGSVSERLGDPATRMEWKEGAQRGPSCPLPALPSRNLPDHLDEPLERLASSLVGILALLWCVPAERAEREMARALRGSPLENEASGSSGLEGQEEGPDVLPLDRWRTRRPRQRLRVDRRQGRVTRGARGRAA